ncbi:class IV lanthionine synthetase LanL [Streptosporangium carneum]|uniref:Serine/threonine protein kinase n=1 Tax=Streptosporangium carneum TaxID=47481 RepID=A0A9W6I0J3_9ACTN|nr:class IV lanthionine synthetase LanL [Streptosporangium carneum]GLK09782.1 serine/threonine protein kinase [Streptosporangium carneum]
MKTRPDDPALLRDIVAAELARRPDRDWSIDVEDFWCKAAPVAYPMPAQGWKLHVSATMLSAPVVLSRVAPVLVEAGCAFKFPARLSAYWDLTGPHCPRAHAGKFVTAYPLDDAESVRLAARLDDVTLGLPGPVILSDRPYREGGIVHYRYGAFHGHRTLGNDGVYEIRLRTPEGALVRDERLPRFSPPSFAVSPFGERARRTPQGGRDGGRTRPPSAVLLNDRFVVREAVRHANRGGVYVAEDRRTGAEVIVKEGRPHACSDLGGRDARDRIAFERSRLDALATTGVVPAVVDFFEQSGHVFLVEELVAGTTLRHWSERNAGPLGEDGFGHAAAEVLPVLRRLVAALRAVHRHGHVFRDLSPDNVMLVPGGEVRLIDLEYAAVPGVTVMTGGTPGYLAPELAPHSGRFLPAPDATADLYALGATAYFLATGSAPQLAPDEVTGHAGGRRLAGHVAEVARANETLALLLPLVTGLTAEPGRRWSLEECEEFLDALDARPSPASSPPTPGRSLAGRRPTARDLVADGLAHLVETLERREGGPSPWPAAGDVEVDPCSVNAGVAGILGVLTLARRTEGGHGVDEAAAFAARWLRRRLAEEEVWPPGLYFGRSGALWALHDAARPGGGTGERGRDTREDTREDTETAEFALRAARRLPVDHPSPDVTHGLAGCGMAVLRLALRSGDPVLGERARETFQHLHDARSYRRGRPQWPTPESFDSGLAGANHLGFAHGLAGVGTALLYAATAFGRPEWMASVREVARALGEHADVDGDTAWWPTLPQEPLTLRPRRPHWCSGSSGIGSFLIRYWRATGDQTALVLADKAATAVHRVRWQLGSVPCHGLPGEGEFLLDMAEFTADDRYLRWAEDLARCLEARAVRHEGRSLVPDPFSRVPPGFLGGTAGILAFLLRLRHRNARLWMLDDVVTPAGNAPEGLAAFPQEAAAVRRQAAPGAAVTP